MTADIKLTDRTEEIRPAAVAGLFYPDDPVILRRMVTGYLDGAHAKGPAPKAIIAPHAGYIYSGPVAAEVYATLQPLRERIDRVILLGPSHKVYLHGMALSSARSFATPLGRIDLDLDVIDKLKRFPQVAVMDVAHAQEHSLEVHLPFLQSVLDHFTLVPIVVGDASPKEVAEVLEEVWGGPETLIVISSDLSHYHNYETARKLDTATSHAIENFELDNIGPEQACGCMPMRGLIYLAKQRDMEICTLDLRNSGDTAGPRDQVVGYGAYALYSKQLLSPTQKCQLLETARASIEQGFDTDKPLEPEVAAYDSALQVNIAAFVTLYRHKELRGCMGTIQAASPLITCVAQSAFNAAFRDPRFPSLTRLEYEQIKLSISVLSQPVEIPLPSESKLLTQLRPKIDGLIIEKGVHKATFLPDVWESLPNPQQFLSQLKIKAGMRPDDRIERAWRYTSESFSE